MRRRAWAHSPCAANHPKIVTISALYRDPMPLKLTRSPVSKMRRRYRTGTEQKGSALTSSSSTWQTTVHNYQVPSLKGKTIDDFKMNHTEIMSLEEVKDELHFYMLHKIALQSTESPDP